MGLFSAIAHRAWGLLCGPGPCGTPAGTRPGLLTGGGRAAGFVYATLLAGAASTWTLSTDTGSRLYTSSPMTETAATRSVATRDDTPTRVLLVPRRNLLPGTEVVANTVRLSGITVPVGVAVSDGASVSVNGSAFGSGPMVADRGQPIIVRAVAPAAGQTAVVEVVTGTVTTAWSLQAMDSPGHTHQVLYGPWGACDAAQPCDGLGRQSRETLCLRSDGRFVPVADCGADVAAVEIRSCPSPAGSVACAQPPAGTSGWTQYCAAGSTMRGTCTGSSCQQAFAFDGSSCVQQVFAGCAADSAAGGWRHAGLDHGAAAVPASRETPAGALPAFTTAATDTASVTCDDGTASAGPVTATLASACAPSHRLSDGACAARLAGTTITWGSGGTIPENTGNALAGTLTTDDPDTPPSGVTYALVAGSGDADNGLVTVSAAGEVRVLGVIDHEARPSLSLRVEAFDGFNRWQQALTVTVSNVNEAPSGVAFSTGATTQVTENNPANSLVATLSGTDPEGDVLGYVLGGSDSAHFAIAGDQLRAVTRFDHEQRSSYSLQVSARDPSGLTGPAVPLTVTVGDVAETCQTLLQAGYTTSGSYWVDPIIGDNWQTWCDQTTEGGGFTRFYLCSDPCTAASWNQGVDRAKALGIEQWLVKNWDGRGTDSSNAGSARPYHGNVFDLLPTYQRSGYEAFRQPAGYGANSHLVFSNSATASRARAIDSVSGVEFSWVHIGEGAMWGPYA